MAKRKPKTKPAANRLDEEFTVQFSSFKEALLAMPNVGEDADFARRPAHLRRVKI